MKGGTVATLSLGALVLAVLLLPDGTLGSRLFPQGPEAEEAVAGPFTLRVSFGQADRAEARWHGVVEISEGELLAMEGWWFEAHDRISLNQFQIDLTSRRQGLLPKGFLLKGQAPPTARIQVSSNQGNFSFEPAQLPPGTVRTFLQGSVQVEGLLHSWRLTGEEREDDYPSVAVGPQGDVWVAWQSYSGGRDEVRLRKYQGQWRTPTLVPGAEGDVWAPQAVLDGTGRLWIVWSQQVQGNFDIFARVLEEGGEWGREYRLSGDANPDIHPRAVSDGRGRLWVVWQGFQRGNSDLFLRHWDGETWGPEVALTRDEANDWEPALAVGSGQRVWVAWDSYRKGNYDIYLRWFETGKLGPEVAVTDSPLFEAHATVAVDGEDRVWIAWDEAGGQWGKDTGPTLDPRWREPEAEVLRKWWISDPSPGTRLYDSRRIQLVVLEGGEPKVPQADLAAALASAGIADSDYPQLLADPRSGRLALLFHRWTRLGQWDWSTRAKEQAFWEQAVVFFEGDRWSSIWTLPDSMGRPSMRAAGAFAPDGTLWLVWPSDGRRLQQPYQPGVGNLFATSLPPTGESAGVVLRTWTPPAPAPFRAVHPREEEEVARIRSYRTFIHGVEHRILRGDLHRHTEFSWDNGGLRDGSFLDFYRYALDAAALDFGAITDHNSGGDHEYWGWLIEKSCDLFFVPPVFTTLYGYERSVLYPGGHRNVFHTRRGIPVISFFTRGDFGRPRPGIAAHPRILAANDTELLYESLRQSGGLSIPHTTGSYSGTDWRSNDPEVEPLVEIYQGARVSYEYPGAPRAARTAEDFSDFQEAGFVWNAYRKGYRLGVIASSDHWSTHISYAMVYVPEPTREAIFQALRNRRTYGATDNIILDYRMGSSFMGEELSTPEALPLTVRVRGTGPVERLDLFRNEILIYTLRPGREEVTFRYLDRDAMPGESRYYVRVQQEDGQMAWGSPIWVRYQP